MKPPLLKQPLNITCLAQAVRAGVAAAPGDAPAHNRCLLWQTLLKAILL